MAAGGKRHAGASGGDVFDVRVVAFAGGSARTLQALQELFGLDREAAQRLVDNVPLVVRRAAPANEAQNYVEALRGIGAEVALERPDAANDVAPAAAAKKPPPPAPRKPPPPPQAKVPPPPPKVTATQIKVAPPPPRDAEQLPRPILRQHTADLEFDLATPGAAGSGEPVSTRDVEPRSTTQAIAKGAGKRSRNEIEFSDGADTGRLELDVEPARAPAKREEKPLETAVRSDPVRTATIPNVRQSLAPERPMSRAAVVHKPGIEHKEPFSRRRTLGLLRMLGAVSVAAAGIWLDSSIVYGNANLPSVLLHALAIYQFGVGLRGMAP